MTPGIASPTKGVDPKEGEGSNFCCFQNIAIHKVPTFSTNHPPGGTQGGMELSICRADVIGLIHLVILWIPLEQVNSCDEWAGSYCFR